MAAAGYFLGPISAATGWSRAAISSAMTLDFLLMGLAGFAWGAASDRLGARVVVLAGAAILGAGLWLASRATSPLLFQLGFGVFVGIAAGAFFAPMPSRNPCLLQGPCSDAIARVALTGEALTRHQRRSPLICHAAPSLRERRGTLGAPEIEQWRAGSGS
jgi:MFS family permease